MKTNQNPTFFKNLFVLPFVFQLYNVVIFLLLILCSGSVLAQEDVDFYGFMQSGVVAGTNKIAKVPIEIYNNEILMKVKVNGNDATFMWDNGCSTSCIDNSLVEFYKFLPHTGDVDGNISLNVIDGNRVVMSANTLVCPKLEINDILISDTPFIQIDFRTFTMTKDLEFVGIIGASIINKLNWKFNFDEKYVEVCQKAFELDSNDLILPFNIINDNTHYMPVTFNGIRADCQIDFGYNSDEINIFSGNAPLFSEAKATKTIGPKAISMAGMGKIDTIYTIKDNFTWKLTGKKLDIKPKISFTKSTSGAVIGNKLFRNRYNVTINTSDSTVYALSSRKKPEVPKPDKTYAYKLHIVNGVFKVFSIDYTIDTANDAVKLLDEVTSINGKVPEDFEDNFSLMMYQKKLLERQKKMVLKFSNGKEITLMPQPGIEYEFDHEKQSW